ncbi:MAG: hypothetical protein Q7V63_09095 [Gammaproteobacteria bacterium]|nr:hypothetical protein [Gammaproteobacteria bacterium]
MTRKNSDELIPFLGPEHMPLNTKSDNKTTQETLHLISITGMKESIVDGLNTPLSKCAKQLKW